MTDKEFTEYCIENKPTCIVPSEFEGFKIFFENGEYIEAYGGIDGIVYTHVSEEVKTNSSQLFKDMDLLIADFLPNLMEKYGDTIIDPIRGRLYNKDGEKIYDVIDNNKKE